MFPGDTEFCINNFFDLPYVYVLEAFSFAVKEKKRRLHEDEAPIALLCSLIANSNRDPKKNKKPYKMNDFFLYEPQEDRDIPMGTYGSAAMKLIEMNLFPSWGLFVYKDLKQSASGAPPSLLAFISSNAVILAPVVKDETVKGMLICEDRSFNSVVEMESPCGQTIKVKIPSFDGRYAAVEDIEIEITD